MCTILCGSYNFEGETGKVPKGVGVGGGCVPSRTKRGKLKRSYMYILGFTESHLSHTLDPIQEAIEFFCATKTYNNVIIVQILIAINSRGETEPLGKETHPAGPYADKPLI